MFNVTVLLGWDFLRFFCLVAELPGEAVRGLQYPAMAPSECRNLAHEVHPDSEHTE